MGPRPGSLILATLSSLAVGAQDQPVRGTADLRLLVHKVDALLRESNGTKLQLEESDVTQSTLRRTTHRVLWHSRTEDQRLVGITIVPVGEESAGTATLTAALLVSLAAVDSLEAGLAMANLVKTAQESDGQSRMVSLRQGIKLMRLRADEAPARYKITL